MNIALALPAVIGALAAVSAVVYAHRYRPRATLRGASTEGVPVSVEEGSHLTFGVSSDVVNVVTTGSVTVTGHGAAGDLITTTRTRG